MIGLIGLLRFKWTWLIVGIGCVAFGGLGFVTAHPATPVEIDGTIADYQEFTQNDVYDHNELTLTGDSRTYTLDKTSFHPALPDSLYKDGRVSIWVDSGSTTVIAITLYDQNDQNPTKYTTAHYDNPTSERSDTQTAGIVAAVIGALLIGIFTLMLVLGRRASRPAVVAASAAQPATVTAGAISPDGKWYWDGVRWVAREAPKVT